MVSHQAEKPFQCLVCRKPFKSKRSQESHQYLCHHITDGLTQSRIFTLELQKKYNALKSFEAGPDWDVSHLQGLSGEMILPGEDMDQENHSGERAENLHRDAVMTDSSEVSVDSESQPVSRGQLLNEFSNLARQTRSYRRTPAAKPYSCEQCGRGFKYLHTLRFHVKTVHDSNASTEPRLSRLRRENSLAMVHQNMMLGQQFGGETGREEERSASTGRAEKITVEPDLPLETENKVVEESCTAVTSENTKAQPKMFELYDVKAPESKICDTLGNNFDKGSVSKAPGIPVVQGTNAIMNYSLREEAWQNIRIQSETPLGTKIEGIHPVTEQQYTLYKCCLCSNAYPSLSILCSHLSLHTRAVKEHHCEKCGAVFRWRSQLLVHEQVHQVIEGKLGNSAEINLMAQAAGPPLLNAIPEALIGEPRVAFDQRLQLSLGQPLLPGFFPCNPALSLAAGLPVPVSSPPVSQSSSLAAASACNQREVPQGRLPFQCSFCSKSFDRVFSLQRHERIHTGVKPCYCKVCGRGFSERRNLRHHIIRFHSDCNQRDQLRRRRRAAAARSRGNNSSLKLVSFLKKTAVRILNSMDQAKEDPNENEDNVLQNSEMENDRDPGSHTLPQEKDPNQGTASAEEEDNTTVIYPLDVSGDRPEGAFTNGACSSHENIEVLQDPKRSLIGNKRKGRPFRYPAFQANLPESSPEHPEAGDASSESPLPLQVQIKVEDPEDSDEYDGDEDDGASRADEDGPPDSKKAVWAQLEQHGNNSEDDRGNFSESNGSFKLRLRGHGAFFSSYNPRLGVVDKPVSRDEACKPQLGPDGKYVYPCSYCCKTFCSTSDLNRHMDFHEDIRPFKCPYCSYFSRTNSQLKVHMMRHEGIKQYLCQACNYNGVTQSDLNRHCKTRSHILRNRNVCVVCGIGFCSRILLEDHMRKYDHFSHEAQVESFGHLVNSSSMLMSSPEDLSLTCDRSINKDISERNNNDYNFVSKNSDSSRTTVDSPEASTHPDIPKALVKTEVIKST